MPNRTQKSASRISRRTVLRGAGVTMALPWLESFAAKAATTGATAFPTWSEPPMYAERIVPVVLPL